LKLNGTGVPGFSTTLLKKQIAVGQNLSQGG
jgi:hypothetical protein